MKRGISFFLACLFMATTSLTLFAGCGEDTTKMLVSEWLYLVNSSFGFSSYTQEEPYVESVTADNPNFAVVQTAYEYSVLPNGYTALDLDSELTREFCALTLAGAIYHKDETALDISDASKLMFPEAVTTVVNKGVMTLDSKGRFNPADEVPYDEAVAYIDKAYDAWVNHKFDRSLSFTVSENMVDFAGFSTIGQSDGSSYEVDAAYVEEQQQWLTANNFSYDSVSGEAHIDNIADKNIKVDSIITLPESLENPAGLYLKVVEIKENSDGTYTLVTAEPTLDEIFPDGYVYQGTDVADFSKAVIYDANGNILSAGRFADDYPTATNMSNGLTNMGGASKISIPVYIGGQKATIKIEATTGKLAVDLDCEVSDDATITFGKEFTNFEFINSVSCNPCDYMKLGMQYTAVDKFKFTGESESDPKTLKDYDPKTVNNEKVKKWMQDIANYAAKKAELSPTVAKIKIPVAPACTVDMAVKLRFTLEGTIEVALTYAGQGVGVEKRTWSFNPFDWRTPAPVPYFDMGTKTNTAISGSVKAEVTVGLNAAACVANFNVIDIEPAVGVGLKMSGQLNYINAERQPVMEGMEVVGPGAFIAMLEYGGQTVSNAVTDVNEALDPFEDNAKQLLLCFETKLYPIAKLTAATSDSLIGEYVGSVSAEFLNEESSPIFESHAEVDTGGFHWTDCTLKDRIDDGIERGDCIEITPMTDSVIDIDEEVVYKVTKLPETDRKIYTLEDLEIDVVDRETGEITSVVTVKSNFDSNGVSIEFLNDVGNFFKNIFSKNKTAETEEDVDNHSFTVKGISAGDAVITIRTRDNLFKTQPINIRVNTAEESLNDMVTLKTYSASVANGNTIKLTVENVPEGKDESSIFWESDDSSIARINACTGEITGVSEGICTIKAYLPGNEETAVYCMITVTKDYTSTNISLDGIENPSNWIKIDGLPVIIIEEI